MTLIEETETHQVYVSYWGEHPIRFVRDKSTGETLASSEDMAQAMGYNSLHELLIQNPGSMDVYLDAMNDGKIKENGFYKCGE